MTTTAQLRRTLIDAAQACAQSALDTTDSTVAEQCARAARDLAEAHRLLRPAPRTTDPEGA